MLRPIGDRLLVRPVPTGPPPDRIIQTLDEDPPIAGDVLAVGRGRCDECGNPLAPAVTVGMRVALRPSAVYQEVSVDGETLWMVRMDDVIGEVLCIVRMDDATNEVEPLEVQS